MTKLALLALVIGTGACVADEADSVERVDVEISTPVDQAVLPPTSATAGTQVVVVSVGGVGLPDQLLGASTEIDISNAGVIASDPAARAFCALTDAASSNGVCSALCTDNFAARVFGGQGGAGDCTQTACTIHGTSIIVDVCL